jgi:small conductance mechanosensitive channel
MESLSQAFDWNSPQDWFSDEGVWFIVTLVVAVVVYIALRVLAPRATRAIVHRMDLAPTVEEVEQQSRTTSRVVVWVGTLAILVGLVLASLPRFGVDLSLAGDPIVDWLAGHGVRIALILVLAFVASRIQRRLVHKVVERGAAREKGKKQQAEYEQRVDTLSSFISQVVAAVIWISAGFMILAEVGVNIAPLLASAGVIGIGIGFGAQTLVKDILSGLFIITENQYHKGDWIMISGVSGSVEAVNMRRTILRDLDGVVHVIPNGEVRLASNYTREYGRVNFDVSVGYGEDLDRAIEVINRVGDEMAQEDYWSRAIMDAPHVLRVNNLGDSGIDIRVYGNTKRMRQWEVMGELRKRIKSTFDEEGIEIPWPHTKVYFGNPLERKAEGEAGVPPRKPGAKEAKETGQVAKGARKRVKERKIPTDEEEEAEAPPEGDGG